jgi:hypothetical protein
VNRYQIIIVRKTRFHIFFNLFVNNILTNTDGYICMEKEDFDRFFKDLFRSSRGNCFKAYSINPPAEFYP